MAQALVDLVFVVDLHVDEGDLVAEVTFDLLGDVHHRPADPALAKLGRREQQHHRLLAEDVGEVLVVHRVGRYARVDLGDVGDLVSGRRVDDRGLVTRLWNGAVVLADEAGGREQGSLVGAAVLDQRREGPLAGLVEGDLGDVDDVRGVGVVGGRLGPEGGLRREVLDAGGEGPDRRPLQVRTRGGVDRDLRVIDLIAGGGEDAEGEAVLAHVEDPGRGRNDRALRGRVRAENLLERLALGGGEVGGRRGRLGGALLAVGGAAAAARQRREQQREDQRGRGPHGAPSRHRASRPHSGHRSSAAVIG